MTTLVQFWQWWAGGLSAPLPPLFRKPLGNNKSTVWAAPDPDGFRFISRTGAGWKTIAVAVDGSGISKRARKRLNSNRVILQVLNNRE